MGSFSKSPEPHCGISVFHWAELVLTPQIIQGCTSPEYTTVVPVTENVSEIMNHYYFRKNTLLSKVTKVQAMFFFM